MAQRDRDRLVVLRNHQVLVCRRGSGDGAWATRPSDVIAAERRYPENGSAAGWSLRGRYGRQLTGDGETIRNMATRTV
jgi:hypothetical protein